MLETIRKYSSVLMLILMGMVLTCFVADEYVDSQQSVKQTASASMAVVADDFDLDDDDDEVIDEFFIENNNQASFPVHETNGQKTRESKCPKALLLGQIRRYSPRSSFPDSHNYSLFEKNEKWCGCVPCHFFCSVCEIKSLNNSIL